MNFQRTVYDAQGLFLHTMDMPDEKSVLLNTPAGATAVEGFWPEETYLKDGAPVPLPERPGAGEFWIFDPVTEIWGDPRDAEAQAAALVVLRAEVIHRINVARGETRKRFITAIPGQDMVYLEKERTARAWMAEYMTLGEEPDPALYPAIIAEVGLTGETAYQVAYVYIHMAEQWRQLSPLIERVSIKYLNLAEALPDDASLRALPEAHLLEMDATLTAALSAIANAASTW